MRRSSLRRSSVVALASASVGVAAPIPDPSLGNLFSGLGTTGCTSSGSNQISTSTFNSLIGSLYNLVGSQGGAIQNGASVQVEFQNILKSFGFDPVTSASSTRSATSSTTTSPTASPRPSVSGSVSSQGGVVLKNPFTQGNEVTNEIDNIVNGILGYGKAGSVSAGIGVGNNGVSIGASIGVLPTPSPSASPQIPVSITRPSASVSASASVAVPKPTISATTGSGVQISSQVNAQGVVNGVENTVNSLQNTVNGVVNGASNLVGSIIQSGESAVKGGTQNIAGGVSSVISKSTPTTASAGVRASASANVAVNPLGIFSGLQGFTSGITGSGSNGLFGNNGFRTNGITI